MDDVVAYAAEVAPLIDGIRIAIAGRSAEALLKLDSLSGVTPETGFVFSMLRNLAPDRVVGRADVDAPFLYGADPTPMLEQLAADGAIVKDRATVQLTAAGVASATKMLAVMGDVIATLWAPDAADFAALHIITTKAIAAAAETGGPAFAVMAPQFVPEGQDPRASFAESLTPLRFHRFDAHVAAWRARGLSPAEVQALPDGATKAEIETETNRRAAPPYAALSETERTMLLDALVQLQPPDGALPT